MLRQLARDWFAVPCPVAVQDWFISMEEWLPASRPSCESSGMGRAELRTAVGLGAAMHTCIWTWATRPRTIAHHTAARARAASVAPPRPHRGGPFSKSSTPRRSR